MTPLRALAIDDEPLALRVLTEHARRVPFLQLVGTTDPVQGLLQGRCAVVLTTAYPQYALEGYEHAVADYLLKPISFERFLKAVQRVHAQAGAGAGSGLRPAPSPGPADLPAYSFIKTEHRLVRVNHADIRYIEGGRDYATVFTSTERILTLTSLSKLLEGLPQPQFMRVHKSYIVRLEDVRQLLSHGSSKYELELLSGTVLPVGRERYKELKQALC